MIANSRQYSLKICDVPISHFVLFYLTINPLHSFLCCYDLFALYSEISDFLVLSCPSLLFNVMVPLWLHQNVSQGCHTTFDVHPSVSLYKVAISLLGGIYYPISYRISTHYLLVRAGSSRKGELISIK